MISHPRSVLTLIAARVAIVPDAIAATDDHDQWSYAQLWQAAGQTAAAIQAVGMPAQQPILLGVRPGTRWSATLLGIWWAGGIAVPVDLEQPPARLATLAQACHAALAVTDDGQPVAWAPTLPTIRAADCEHTYGRLPRRRPGRAACIFFTSGSTGTPKPVLLGHLGMAQRAIDMADQYAIASADRIAQLTAPTFDPILWELLPALIRGGQIHIASRDNRVPGPALAGWLAVHRITAFTCTPTVLAALPFIELPDLRLIVVGGEALHPGQLDPWLGRYPVANAYGPTELTTEALVAFPVKPTQRPVPIGRPYHGIGVRILNEDGRPVPDGEVGELHLSGPGLALEYLDRPEQTAAAFPYLQQGTTLTRHFRTGDLVQRLPDGQLTFIGRRDRQLNLGGVRLEPGEVEACALQLDGIHAAAATTVTRGHRTILVLVMVADPVATSRRLREHLAEHLPAAAVPTEIHAVDQLPRTPSGKVDYTALERNALSSGDDTGPVGTPAPLPELVLSWWHEFTGQLATEGADFFAGGGTSLAALRLISQINQEFATTLTITHFLANPTTDLLADVLARTAVPGGDVP